MNLFHYLICALSVLPQHVFAKTSAQLCRGTSALANDGNWYCSEVKAITYKNINQPGEYNRTTRVNPKTGICEHQPISYSGVGPFTPLIGELSMHLRGPMNVSQIAVYKLPDMSIGKRSNTALQDSEPGVISQVTNRQSQHERLEVKFLDQRLVDTDELDVITQAPSTIGHGYCIFTPTITMTVFAGDNTCNKISVPSMVPPTLAIFPLPPAAVPPAPPILPPPPAIPAPAPAPPRPPAPAAAATTTVVHVTNTICPKSSSSSSDLPTRHPQANYTASESECPCDSTLEAKVSSTDEPLAPTTSRLGTGLVGDRTKMDQPVKRREQDPVTESKHSLATTPLTTPSRTEDVEKRAASTWSRVAYYTSATPAAATGFAFLANLGDPQKSGTFDYSFGNSLGYVIGDGSKVTTQSTPFDGTLETSEIEIAAFTDKVCDGNCEYVRPDTAAHYGWDGSSKAFFIEFQMDHYDNIGHDQGMLSDAPAWWFLNAAIPRILQYGNDRNNIPCSCWSTGCGEFDAFEILGRGEMRAKSTIHRQGNLEGGDSNYFLRPVGRMLKVAVIFHNWNITARVLPDGFDFADGLSQEQIDRLLAYDPNDATHSLFAVGD